MALQQHFFRPETTQQDYKLTKEMWTRDNTRIVIDKIKILGRHQTVEIEYFLGKEER